MADIEQYRAQLGNRACNALLRSGITTIEKLARTDEATLLNMPWFGVKSLERVNETLNAIAIETYGPEVA